MRINICPFSCPILFLLSLFFIVAGCCPHNELTPADSSCPAVLTTVPPVANLISRIAGDKIRVEILVPPGTEPENFSPTPSVIRQMAKCSLFFRVGLASESAVSERLGTANPKMKMIDLRESLADNPLFHDHNVHADEENHQEEDHQDENSQEDVIEEENHHGHHCADCEGGMDPHLWMSPSLLADMASEITRQLTELTPENRADFEANLAAFQSEIESLQSEIKERLDPLTNRTIYVFHPAYGYYCREFNLVQRGIEEGGKSPKTKTLVDLIREIRSEKGAILLAQPEFDQVTVQKISESVPIETAYHSPLGSDCIQNLRDLTNLIATADKKEETVNLNENAVPAE